MAPPRRLVLVRHGDTVGESSIRYHGRSDVALSQVGREQIRRLVSGSGLPRVDRVVASSLSRARESAQILAPDHEIAFEDDFREVHFGRWEGLTASEIESRDPGLFAAWQRAPARFDYPDGEKRADFRERVQRGIERWLPRPGESVLAVLHKGVIRVAVAHLCRTELADGQPPLAGVVVLESAQEAVWRHTGSVSD